MLDEAQASWLIPSFASRQERPDDAQRRRWRDTKRLQRSRLPLPPPAETWDDPDAEEPLSAPAPHNQAAEHDTGALISRLAGEMSADRLLDKGRTVPLKRRGETEYRGQRR